MKSENIPRMNNIVQKERMERIERIWARLTKSTLSAIGLFMVVVVAFCAIMAPIVAPFPQDATGANHLDQVAESPSFSHPMGTDMNGRDIFSRVIFGSRISLSMGFVVIGIAVTTGVTLGLIAGYLGGKIGAIIMRTCDIFLAIPATLLALAVTAVLGPTLTNAMVAISFGWWPWYTRIVQGEVLSVKQMEFVEASEALGSGFYYIMTRELLPNVMAPVIVKATMDIGFVILVGASLGFLGLGAQPPTPDWGVMIAQGRSNLTTYWWIATFPGIAISFTVFGFNLLGDGLRDVFDVEEQL
jgi:peptide/nickel transport system permease protein